VILIITSTLQMRKSQLDFTPRKLKDPVLTIMLFAHVTERMKAQTPCRTRNPQGKATKTFHAKKVLRRERKRLSVKGKRILINSKVF